MEVKTVIAVAGAFIFGAAIGYDYARTKYDDTETKQELESLRKRYLERLHKEEVSAAALKEEEYAKAFKESLDVYSAEEKAPEEVSAKTIRFIPPTDYESNESYNSATLTYYADRVLAYDSDDTIVTDIPGTIGEESLNHLYEYGTDVVYVVNDKTRTYYEITLSNYTYSECTGNDISVDDGY